MGPYMGQVLTEVFTGESARRHPTGRHRRPKTRATHLPAEVAGTSAPTRFLSLSRWLRGLAPARRNWQRQPEAH
ncbi:MAG TPA: hypothetical protein VKG85_08720 [Actinomycetes bacterium]|nr:hypothetical protein [Actinomycetes bacterium]